MSYEQLYCENLPVLLKSLDREDRHVTVKVTVIVQYTISPVHKKELLVRLTDECDPFFLYTITLGDEDFQGLKVQQGLLVDFSAFPQKFIDLLQLCQNEEGKDCPKFLLQFLLLGTESGGQSHLNVVETNPFKHLIHLSLLLSPGTDHDVKKYLAECLKHFKTRNSNVEKKLGDQITDLSSRLTQTQEALSERTREAERLRGDWTSLTQQTEVKHTELINIEKEKSIKMQVDLQRRVEQDKKDLEFRYQTTTQQLELRVSELEHVNRDLTDTKYKSESRIREQTSRAVVMEEEATRTKLELQTLRRDNSQILSGSHDQEKTTNSLITRVAVLEQEVKDKDQVIDKTSALLESSQQQIRHIESLCEQKQANVSKQDVTIKTMSEELIKANEIIRKLQGELKSVVSKIKLKNTVTTQQEKRIQEKEQLLEKLKHDLNTATDNYKHTSDENEKLQESLLTTTRKLDESRQLLKTNENVINWLNKQVNEVQLQKQKPLSTGTFELSSQSGNTRSSRVTYNPNTAYMPSVVTGRSPASLLPGVDTSTPTGPNIDGGPSVPNTSPVVAPLLDVKYLQRYTDRRVGPPLSNPTPPLMSAYFPPNYSQSKS